MKDLKIASIYELVPTNGTNSFYGKANSLMKSNIILLLALTIFVVSVTTTFSECVRCLNGIAVILLAFAYFKTSQGKELINKVYNQIIK